MMPINRTLKQSQTGLSLIEMMVAMTIGLVVSLAIYGVLNVSEGRKRTTTSTNDIDQSGAYTIYQFGKMISSAGSGFAASIGTASLQAGNAYACPIYAAFNNNTVLPATAAFPAPFASVSQNLNLAPIIIMPGIATRGDVILTMFGSGGLSEAPTDFSATPTANNLKLKTLANYRGNDIVLVAQNVNAGATPICLIEQVDNGFTPSAASLDLPLSGTYYKSGVTAGGTTRNLTDYVVASTINLGQAPTMAMFGVGSNNTLMRYDLLRPANTTLTSADANPSVFGDSVYAMYAIYGVDNDNNSATTTLNWVLPTGTYAPANLLANTSVAAGLMQTIKAVKIGIIMQSALPEKLPAGQAGLASPGVTYTTTSGVTTGAVTLFQDTPTATQITQTVSPLNVRYRVFETTIPIRNALIAPN